LYSPATDNHWARSQASSIYLNLRNLGKAVPQHTYGGVGEEEA